MTAGAQEAIELFTQLPVLPAAPADLYEIESVLAAAGVGPVAGIDEAGRGPLAGPVVAAAVALPPALRLPGLNDSKQLTADKRDLLFAELLGDPRVLTAISVIGAELVDAIDIGRATALAMQRAAAGLIGRVRFLLVDGRPVKGLPLPSQSLVKGDGKCAAIAAASVMAKVWRDRLMLEYDLRFPQYGFAVHKGYATPMHLQQLQQHGPCPIHRRSFAPLRQQQDERQLSLF